MNVASVSNYSSQQNKGLSFRASLVKCDSLTKYLGEMSSSKRNIAEEALGLLSAKLKQRPESDVLYISKMDPKKAKTVVVGSRPETVFMGPQQYYGHLNWFKTGREIPIVESEDLELSVGNKTLGFFMNLQNKPEELAKWLEDTYEYLRKGLV